MFLLRFRSKEIEATGCNGDAAFLAVRVQQVVIEFILNHVDQIFNNGTPGSLENDGNDSSWHPLLLCPRHGIREQVRVGWDLALSVSYVCRLTTLCVSV